MKILVTGAAGFIGSYVCKYLLSRGDEVVGLDNINSYYDINLKYGRLLTLGIEGNAVNWYLFVESNVYEKFRFIRMNLEDKQAMQMLFANERFDKVVNLAAQAGVRYSIENPYAYVESNIDGFLNVLEGCRHYRVKHLIYASSSNGDFVLHRVIGFDKDGKYIFCGDNQFHKERGITDENIIGVVTAFYRKGKHYTDNSLSYRFYKSAWEYIKAPMRMLYSAHRMNKSIKIKKKR